MALGTDGLITVVGDFDALDGSPVSGKVTVTPSVQIVKGAVTYPQIPTVVALDADGKFSLKLPATDDPTVSPNGFTYKVDIAVTAFVNGRAVTDVESSNVSLAISDANTQGVANLSALLPAPAVGTPTIFLTRGAADARYLLKTDIPELPSNIITEDNIGEFLEPVDLTGYTTTAQATSIATAKAAQAVAGIVIPTPDLTGLATTDALSTVDSKATDAKTAATQAQQATTYINPADARTKALEGVKMLVFGHSFGNGGTGSDDGSRFFDRVAKRRRVLSETVYAVGGKRSDQVLMEQVRVNWTAGGRGFVGLAGGIRNDQNAYASTSGGGLTTVREVFRSIFAHLTAKALILPNTGAFSFDASWTVGTTAASTTVNSVGNFAFNGDTAYLLVGFSNTTTRSIRISGTGFTTTTVSLGPYEQSFVGAVKISGLGAGDHQMQVTVVTGGATIYGLAVPSEQPPLVVWMKDIVAPSAEVGKNKTLAQYQADITTNVLPSFPGVLVVTPDNTWSASTMVAPDFVHPNDLGNAYFADLIERALYDTPFVPGLNQLTTTGPTYTSPSATAIGGGGPSAPTALTLAATPGDGQVTITPSGATGQTSYALYRGTSATGTLLTSTFGPFVDTGRANGTPVSYYAVASNTTGNVNASTSATPVAAGSGGSVFVSDTFTDTSGTSLATHVGEAGATYGLSSTFSSASGALTGAVVSATGTLYSSTANTVSAFTSGVPTTADYTVEADVVFKSLITGMASGIIGRMSTTAKTGYYIRYVGSSAGWRLDKAVAGTQTTIGAVSAATLTPGTTYHLTLQMVGSTIVGKVNGVTLWTVTDTSITDAGRAGFILTPGTAETDTTGFHLDNLKATTA